MRISCKLALNAVPAVILAIVAFAPQPPAAEYLTANEAAQVRGMGCYGSKDVPCTEGDGDDCDETTCNNGACPAGSKERDPNTKSASWYQDYGQQGYGYQVGLMDLDDVECGTQQSCASNCNQGMDGNQYCAGAAGASTPWKAKQKTPTGAECARS